MGEGGCLPPGQAAVSGPANSAHSPRGLNLGRVPSPSWSGHSELVHFGLSSHLPGRCACLSSWHWALFPLGASSHHLH